MKHPPYTCNSYLIALRNILFFLIIWCLEVSAQSIEPVSNSISIKQGLASRKVKQIFQDSYGWLWITTDISLHRFDGYVVERMDDKLGIHIDQTIRPKQIVWEDQNKLIWIKDENQMIQFEPLTESIERFNFLDAEGQNDTILFSLVDHEGQFLIKNKNSNLKVFKNDNFVEIPNTNGRIFNEYTEEHILSMQLNFPNGYILQASKFNTYILDENFTAQKEFRKERFRSSKGLEEFGFSIKKDKSGHIFGEVQQDYFYEYNAQLDSFMLPKYLESFPIKTKIGSFPIHNKVIFSSKGEIWQYDYESEHLHQIKNEGETHTDQIIPQMLLDQTGNLWLATYFGVQKINSPQSQFESIELNNTLKISYPNSSRSIVDISEDELLIGAKFTSFIYNLKDESIERLPYYKNNMWSTVRAEGDLWGVRLGDPGIYKFNNNTKRFKLLKFPIQANLPVAIDYHNGYLWTGDGPLIIKYHIKSKEWSHFDWTYGRVNDFYFESDNSIFFACNKGLIQVDSSLNVLSVLSTDNSPKLSSNQIQNIYVDENGIFWLSTRGGGVYKHNKDAGTTEIIDINNGLPNNTVYAVIPDGDKYWMPTDNGLALYDKISSNINTFFTEHGLSHNEFNFPSQFAYKDKIYLGTLNGVTVIDATVNYLNDMKPNLFVTSITTYDQKLKLTKSHKLGYDENEALIISANESNLEIKISLADYTNLEENRFAYKLEGIEDDWVQLGNNHVLHLGTLPAGKFKLHLSGYTNSGLSTDKTISIPIVVNQPFTKSRAFIILLIAGLSALFYGMYRIRLRQLEKIAAIRQRIAANLHDEVGSIMTHVALESDLLLAKMYEGEDINKKLAEIAYNSREASSVMSDIVWSFDWNEDKTVNLIDRMRQFLHKMLSSRDIKFQLNAESLNMNKELTPDVRQNIYLIFKEAIHNIVKHSDADEVMITMKQKSKKLILTIDDNGNDLFQSSATSSGQGLRNMHYRAKIIGAELEIFRSAGYHIKVSVNIN